MAGFTGIYHSRKSTRLWHCTKRSSRAEWSNKDRQSLSGTEGNCANHSCTNSISQFSCCLTSVDLPITQPQSDELLKAGINLLMHGGIPGRDIPELLEQPRAAVEVVPFGILQSLAMVGSSLLGSFQGVGLGLSGSSPLHCLSSGGAQNALLATDGGILFLRGLVIGGAGGSHGRGLWGTGTLRRGVVVHSPHVVVEIPPTGKSVSRNRPVASFK